MAGEECGMLGGWAYPYHQPPTRRGLNPRRALEHPMACDVALKALVCGSLSREALGGHLDQSGQEERGGERERGGHSRLGKVVRRYTVHLSLGLRLSGSGMSETGRCCCRSQVLLQESLSHWEEAAEGRKAPGQVCLVPSGYQAFRAVHLSLQLPGRNWRQRGRWDSERPEGR